VGAITFSCPNCDQPIQCHETYAGKQIQCPSCDEVVTVAAPGAGQSSSRALDASSKLALSSLILSCLSILLGPLGFLPGIICGYLAKERIRRKPELQGLGYARAGLAIGFTFLWLSVAIVIGCLIMHVVNLNSSPQASNRPTASNTVVQSSARSAATGKASATNQGAVLNELQKAEQAVQNQVKLVQATTARFNQAIRNRDTLHVTYKGKALPQATYNVVMQRYKAADDEVANSQAAMNAARNNFEAAFTQYQQLGGKTDYRSQLP